MSTKIAGYVGERRTKPAPRSPCPHPATRSRARSTPPDSRCPRTRTRTHPPMTAPRAPLDDPFCDMAYIWATTTHRNHLESGPTGSGYDGHESCAAVVPMNKSYQFSHHRLDVYRLALEVLREVHDITRRVPRGYRSFADQLLRASGETVALIGEGANRFTAGQKRQRFSEARGEAGEVAVHIETICAMKLISGDDADAVLRKSDRVCAMLTRLIQRHS